MSLRNLINALIRNRKTLIALSAVVVFVTTYLLILPAAALEKGAAEEMGGIDVNQEAAEETADVSADGSEKESIDDSDAESSAEITEVTEEDADPDADSDADPDPDPDSEQPKLTFEGKGFTVDVADPQGVLPEDTELSVSEITTDDKKYDKYYSDALAALADNAGVSSESEPGFVRLYDIKLIAGDQVIEPEESVKVTIAYDNKHKSNSGENALKTENEESVYIVHFKEDETTGEEQAEVLDKEATSFQIRKEQLQEATFEADSFSVYAIVDLPETTASTLDIIGEKGSDGFQISIKTGNGAPSDSNNYYMTGDLIHGVSGNSDRDGITATQYSNTIPGEAIKYYFERIDDSNQFYIYKMDGSERKYIQMTPVSANAGRAGLTFAESESDRTAFLLINETQGRFQVSASITTNSGAQKTYYWVRNTKGVGTGTIVGYENKSDVNTAWIGLHQEGAFKDPYGLDGNSYSLLIWDGGKTGKALTSNANDDHQGNLCADFLTVMTKSGDADDKLYVPGDTSDTVTSWNFEWISEDLYKLSEEVGGAKKYLKIDSNGRLSMVDSPDAASEIQVIPGTGIHKKQIILKSGNNVLTYSGVYKEGFDTNAGAGKEYLYLAEARGESELESYYRTYSATKISVSDPGLSPESPDAKPKTIIIYTRVWNGSGYTYFAIDGEGNLVPCYERGDSIEWIGSTLDELQWEFTEHGSWEGDTFTPNYYYDLKNAYTQQYLAPQRKGKDGESAQILSDNTIGLNMSGRRNGQYYTPILAWDTDNYSYTSINVDLEAGAGADIEACLSRYGLDFYFATVDEIPVDDTLHTVPTVDNNQFGISMKLVNFGTRKEMSDFLGSDEGGMTTKLVKGLLSTKLGDDGYPTAEKGSQESLGVLFGDPPEVNYLFTDSTFRATGYYEYDSAQNFAHLITKETDPWFGKASPNGGTYKVGDFVVYQELGSYDKDDKYTLKHGQFFPFNDLEPGVFASTNGRNLYTPTGKELDESDPRFNEQLYMIKNEDCYFGTELTASFEQTPSGLDAWGHDIIFEFSGDDDFWLYVDDELIIDLGGIHSAVPGTVNFRTGEVKVNGKSTTLLVLFAENKAGRGEYGGNKEAAKAALLNEETGLFTTKTDPDDPTKEYYVFKDNTPHTMRIFYLERGAGASNLHMRFNLAAVKKGTVQLSKKLSNVDDVGANATAYPYQIFYKDPEHPESDWIQLTEADMVTTSGGSVKYKGSVNDVEYRKDYHIDHEKDGVTYRAKYNDVFLLPAGETAEITFPTFGTTGEEKYVTDYYIVECGVDPEIYPNVKVDDEPITGVSKETDIKIENGQEVELQDPADSGLLDYSIKYSTLDERPRVTYDNEVKETKSINIIKELYKKENDTREKIDLYDANGDAIDQDNPDLDRVFEFRLKLRAPNSDTEWKDCNRIIYYHVKDPKGHYCIWDKDKGKLVATDRSTLEDLTEEEKIPYTFESSESGAMSNIPAYYTVEVNGLIPGTEYQVVERPGETPAGYQFWKYKAGTKETPDGYDPMKGIEGSITTETTDDANTVFVCNDKGYELILKKEWADAATIEDRDPSYFAVFYEVKDLDTGEITDWKLIADSVKQLKYNAKPQKLDWWYLNLPEIDGVNDPVFGQFVVYEVEVNDEGAVTNSQNVRRVLNGERLSLNGTPLGGSETEIAYKVTYDDPKTTGDNVREFKATNTPSEDPSVKFLKEDWSENALKDAEFTLKRDSDTVFNKKSNAQGLISTEFLSKDTDYVLEETKAPQGYYGLQESLTVRLIKDASDEWTLSVTPATEDIAKYYKVGDYDQDNNCVTLTIKDRPYEFEAVKVDSTDDSTKIKGAVFNLYEQVTVQGQSDWRIKEWDGQEGLTTDLTTGTDGLIPHIDSSLPAGKYQLREKTAAGGYKKIAGNIEFTVSRQGSITLGNHPTGVELSGPTGDEDTGKLVYTLTIPNDPMPSFKLKKVDRSTDDPLKGAVFQLTKKKGGATGGDGHPIWEVLPDGNNDIDMTDIAEVDLPLLPSGYYRLEENDAPEGYIILEDFIYFHITDDGTVELCNEDGSPFPESEYPAYESLTGDKTAGFVIIAKDSPGSELPHTGGIGTTIFYILGTMLVLGCGVYLIARRRISQ